MRAWKRCVHSAFCSAQRYRASAAHKVHNQPRAAGWPRGRCGNLRNGPSAARPAEPSGAGRSLGPTDSGTGFCAGRDLHVLAKVDGRGPRSRGDGVGVAAKAAPTIMVWCAGGAGWREESPTRQMGAGRSLSPTDGSKGLSLGRDLGVLAQAGADVLLWARAPRRARGAGHESP